MKQTHHQYLLFPSCSLLEHLHHNMNHQHRLLGISDFSDDLIGMVFGFLGRGHFLFVAGTSRQFYRVYERMCKNENDTTKTSMRNAVESISRLQWSRANECPWDIWTCAYAAKNGHLEVLQWARANECPWDWRTCAGAAKNGHLEVLQWARANECSWDIWTCAGAAWNGHLEVLQWARANECPWDWRTCAHAALNGHLEVLQWARANGCPWNEYTCAWANENGHLEVWEWAKANGCPHGVEYTSDEDY